jgi:hypothetical protein
VSDGATIEVAPSSHVGGVVYRARPGGAVENRGTISPMGKIRKAAHLFIEAVSVLYALFTALVMVGAVVGIVVFSVTENVLVMNFIGISLASWFLVSLVIVPIMGIAYNLPAPKRMPGVPPRRQVYVVNDWWDGDHRSCDCHHCRRHY